MSDPSIWDPCNTAVPPAGDDEIAIKQAASGGTANAITLAPVPPIAAHSVRKGYVFSVSATNTGAATLAVSGLPPVALTKFGTTPLSGGELSPGLNIAVYNGVGYELLNVNILDSANTWDNLQKFSGSLELAETVSVATTDTLDLTIYGTRSVLLTGTDAITEVIMHKGQIVFAKVVSGFVLGDSPELQLNYGGNDITVVAGDTIVFVGEDSGVVYATVSKKDGNPVKPIIVPTPALNSSNVRQTVQSGPVNLSEGTASFLTPGSGLTVDSLGVSLDSLIMTMAAGNDERGNIDYVSKVSQPFSITGIAASNVSFLKATLSAGVISYSSTIAPPQWEYAFDRARQLAINFDIGQGINSIPDAYGNLVETVGGAQTQDVWKATTDVTCSLGGTGPASALLETEGIRVLSIKDFGPQSWLCRCKIRLTALPTSGNVANIMGLGWRSLDDRGLSLIHI